MNVSQPVQVSFTPASAKSGPVAPCGRCVQTRFTSTVPEVTQELGALW